jgi:ABC-type transport system involved in multi-copper enzyme maturation permease subunit
MSGRRIRAIVRKEIREYRRRGFVVATAILPVIFLVQPLIILFLVPATSAAAVGQWHLLLYLLAVPVLTPAVLAAYAVAGERQQGSLEPILTTPIPREEFLIGKALAALIPSIGIALVVYLLFVTCVALFAKQAVATAVLRPEDIVAQLLFTPLLAAWSIWVGIAISTRSSDARVAQQLSLLANLPLVAVTSLIAFDTIHPSAGLAVAAAVVLLVADGLGWRFVGPLFDRERLITGTV